MNEQKIEFLIKTSQSYGYSNAIKDARRIIDKYIYDFDKYETDHGMINIFNEIKIKLANLFLDKQ